MKAILVIDMPKRCGDCILYQCGFCIKDFKIVHMDDEPTETCPLKPMPRHKLTEINSATDYKFGYNDGWNDCLDEILGETE